MHRGTEKAGNRFLTQRWQKQENQNLRLRLKNARPMVDISSPTSIKSLKRKSKKEQLKEDRYTQIERENRILLEKIANLKPQTQQGARAQPKSLNRDARRKYLIQVTMENQAFLKRLQDRPPHYNRQDWKKDWQNTQKILKNMCVFPYRLGSQSKSTSKIPVNKAKTKQSTRNEEINQERYLVFKKKMKVQDIHFVVKIFKKGEKVLISAFDTENYGIYKLNLQFKTAKRLMKGSLDYGILAKRLDLDSKGSLILIDQYEQPLQNSASMPLVNTEGPLDLGDLEDQPEDSYSLHFSDESLNQQVQCI